MDNLPVIIPLCIVIVGLITAFIYFKLRDRKEFQSAIQNGVTLNGVIIQANSDLFKSGKMNLPASVLVSFPGKNRADDNELQALVDKLSDEKVQPSNKTNQKAVKIAYEESFRPSRRVMLPLEFSNGYEVHVVGVLVIRSFLEDGVLKQHTIRCRAMPGNSGQVYMLANESTG